MAELTFVYDALPSRVVFGAGRLADLPEEIDRLGIDKALILCSASQRGHAAALAERLGPRAAGLYDKAVMHVPIECAEAGRAEAHRLGADGCVAIGGGSTIGLAKAIAFDSGLPVIAVPTTYSGSEMTPIWGMTEAGVKTTGRDPRVLPKTVIYDPVLTTSLPAAIAGPSGMNALAHCVEALYAENRTPIVSLMAEEGIRALGRGLPAAVRQPNDLAAQAEALYGAWLAGAALGAVGMALHHKVCHALGGSFHLPHAEVHTVILPHAAAYNRTAAPEAMARIARALGAEDAPGALYDLAVAVGAKVALKDIGMRAGDLDRAAEIATRNPYYNPCPVTREGVRALLQNAYEGTRP